MECLFCLYASFRYPRSVMLVSRQWSWARDVPVAEESCLEEGCQAWGYVKLFAFEDCRVVTWVAEPPIPGSGEAVELC